VCVAAFRSDLAPGGMNMFSHGMYLTKTLYKFCTFNAICKVNAAT
jgi:hypothetical protein